MDTPGVVRGKRIEKIGMQSSDTAQLFFEDVRVPKKNIIGQEGKGFIYQMQIIIIWITVFIHLGNYL